MRLRHIVSTLTDESRYSRQTVAAPRTALSRSGRRDRYGWPRHPLTWGLATLEAVKESDFSGRLVVFFQPAEEVSGGGGAVMAKTSTPDGTNSSSRIAIHSYSTASTI
ncbi:hypothetical protein C9J85_16940 [Haloferax sp. wsp5]|nr:hypothetical protein C9J85_16940 [Haloferax sp. wsp5]